MNKKEQGWFKHEPEHSLAARGIKTKTSIRTPKTPIKTTTNKITTESTIDLEAKRLLRLFGDRNYIYPIQTNTPSNGIYITKEDAVDILKHAVPNGCGLFNYDSIQKLSEVYDKDAMYKITRKDGNVIVFVKGEPLAHPGRIREWIDADICTQIDNDIIAYEWLPLGEIR